MYKIKKDKAGEIEILHREGKPLFCPFKPTLLVPGTMAGQLTMHREPCGSWCPHFDHVKVEGKKHIYLTCGRVTKPIELTEPKPQLTIL